jgi:hypothetical protein
MSRAPGADPPIRGEAMENPGLAEGQMPPFASRLPFSPTSVTQ